MKLKTYPFFFIPIFLIIFENIKIIYKIFCPYHYQFFQILCQEARLCLTLIRLVHNILPKFSTLSKDNVFISFEPKGITFTSSFKFCEIDFPIPDVPPNTIALIQNPIWNIFLTFKPLPIDSLTILIDLIIFDKYFNEIACLLSG